MYFIYETTNLVNNKKYAGKHCGELNDSYLGSGILLNRAIDKYGIENFSREILAICSNIESLNILEKMFVNENYVNRKDTYNIALGEGGEYYMWVYYGTEKDIFRKM